MESVERTSAGSDVGAGGEPAAAPPEPLAPKPGIAGRLIGKGPYLLISLAVLALDQWTKWLVELHVPLSAVEPVFPGLNITHVQNTGVAFGMLARDGGAPWLAALVLIALAAVGAYFVLAPRDQRLLLTSLGLILGGALGNLVDRVNAGAVTDFIDVYVGSYHWYFFNVADAAISIGIAMMAFESLRPHRADPAEPDPAAEQ